MGHATRCIPIIKTLQQQGYSIIVAANDRQQKILEQELENVQYIFLKGYEITYSKSHWFFGLKILLQTPKILWRIYQEHQWLMKIIELEKIDIVITDNRFGLFSKKIPSIFITHQLQIKAPFFWVEKLIQKINYYFINQYQQCWIPDVEGENNIAGTLSRPKKLPQTPVHYIGVLSRFKQQKLPTLYDVCILLSGPEPQRTLLEEIVIQQLSKTKNKKIIFVRGLPTTKETIELNHVEVHNHLPQQTLETIINQSEYIISRSGYTTVMELMSLQKKCILIPTPGQTEQEYLSSYLSSIKKCLSFTQDEFNFDEAIQKAESCSYQFNNELQFQPEKIIELMKNILE